MNAPESTKKPQKTAKQILDWLTDRGAMVAAILISLGTVTLMFVVITPDILIYRIVMGTMGAILVLFSPRALAKNKIGLWKWIACLIVFAEVSTVLTMTDTQSHEAMTEASVTVDPVLQSLQNSTKTAQDNLTKNIDQQAAANNRITIDGLVEQFGTLTAIYNAAVARESAYRPAGTTQGGIDPNKLFMAIPTAIFSLELARYMTLAFSLIVAILFQLVIKSTVTATVKQIKRDGAEKALGKKKPPRKPRKQKTEPTEPKPITEEDFQPEPQEPSMMEVL